MTPKIKISKYYNNFQTATSLMIDDLAPVSISLNGEFKPYYDHGFGALNEGSLYQYLQQNLFLIFPEINGTFFILTEQHYNHRHNSGGYKIVSNGFDENYISFLNSISDRFTYAFHGTNHLKIENGKVRQEFTYRTLEDIDTLEKSIKNFTNRTGISFNGGKFPAYMSNEFSDEIIERLGFNWWAFHNKMKGVKHPDNVHSYYGKRNVMRFPTNFSGDAFKQFLNYKKKPFGLMRTIYRNWNTMQLENHLQYLYENQMIISIQEHFTTLRTDGKFQRPNVFDDIESLKKIYSILRGSDMWHATCDEIALYLENSDNSKIENIEGGIELIYSGNREKCAVSINSKDVNVLIDENGELRNAIKKNGLWVFNHVSPGKYFYKKD